MNESALTIRPSNERGYADHGWLRSHHTFSFASYYDPQHMGYRSLRVINEDRVAPSQGFPMHAHQDMEIFTFVVSGQLEHKDSLGNGRIIQAGEFQYMSAGSGVHHSEFNPSDAPVHFLQIWIEPNQKGAAPRYAEFSASEEGEVEGFRLLASSSGRAGSIAIRQDAEIYSATVRGSFQLPATTLDWAWIQLVKGSLTIDGDTLSAGDGASFHTSHVFESLATSDSEASFILFYLI